ncbi:hypothetical protein GCM10010151_26240 [Actinoallomurus spadix]|uniref:NlpC/P60 domain-containing protein n=2 Tax=Actinoallomurus spadix TaxID=79912 RepID=A0ABN0WF34_9ACTN
MAGQPVGPADADVLPSAASGAAPGAASGGRSASDVRSAPDIRSAPGGRSASGADGGSTARDVARGRERVRAQTARLGRISAELAQADALLDDLGVQAESAVERYNAERVELDRAKAAYRAAAWRSAQARHRHAQIRDDAARMAVGAYRGGGDVASKAAAPAGAGGLAGFLTRATPRQAPADRGRALLRREATAKTAADVSERQAREALAAQEEAVRSAADARQAAVAAVTRQQKAVRRIQQRKAALVAELEAVRAGVAALEEARLAAVDQARLARPGTERTVSSHHVVPAGAPAQQVPPTGTSSEGSVPAGASSHQVLTAGTSLHQVASAGTRLGAAGVRALVRGLARSSDPGSVAASAALKWLGTPYSWGGGNEAGPSRGIAQGAGTVGFDCSGLVTYAWAKAGVRLVHYATTQYNAGPHPSRGDLRPGDLVFFAHNPADPSTIHHVGIYIGNGQMVEAPFTGARVRISPAFRPDYAGATRPVAAVPLSDRAVPRA